MRSLLRMGLGGGGNGGGNRLVIPKAALTYVLGKSPSLYIPLTCHSNSRTLPQTRGPGFKLPEHVVSVLASVRECEGINTNVTFSWSNNNNNNNNNNKRAVVAEASSMVVNEQLPPLPKVAGLFPETLAFQDHDDDDGRFPSVDSLLEEFRAHSVSTAIDGDDANRIPVVVAGEGEPTLRLGCLLRLARRLTAVVASTVEDDDDDDDGTTKITTRSLRVVTNGLAHVVPGNPPDTAFRLREAGVDGVSVALMTADAEQYEQLMDTGGSSTTTAAAAHSHVCDFVTRAVECGLDVEVTGVDRPEVDKRAMAALAKQLGVTTNEPRWRPYFP